MSRKTKRDLELENAVLRGKVLHRDSVGIDREDLEP